MIVIKNKQGQAILQLLTEENASVASGVTAVPLNQGSIHHIELMTSEYIRLKFKLAEAVVLKAGCYVEHSLGHFVLDTDYVPEFDKSTGGYVYDVSVKAWYYSWNRYILKLNPEYGCREASFSLTDKISGHIAVFRKNLEKYFDSISLYVDIDSTIDQEKAVSVTYDGVHITDALSTLAEAYECEWWMEDGNHLHFGHCQRSNTPLVWTQDSNAELKRNDSSGQYATRLYVFGSTQNMPKRYRKSLIMYATEIDRTNKRFRDPSRKLSPGVFVASAKDGLKITTTAKWGGTTHSVVLNPGKVATEEASWIYCDELPDSGQSFTIDNILLGKVDASYLTSDYGDEAAIAGWENRLMLPKAKYPGNYIDSESVGTGDLVVEGIVTIDDVYPHKTSPVAGVTNYRTEEEDASDENGETKVTVTHYVLQLEKSEFSFSTDYLLPGQTLRVQFQSGKLAGMSFDLSFKGDKSGTTRQEYEVINNEDYGVLLPNTKLYPAAEDKIILSGYDVSYLSEEGSSLIAAAESKLEEEGLKVLAEQTKDKSTHTVTLKPSYAMSLETQICLGTRVSLQYIPGVTDVTSRVISIERAIDKPYDAPVYTVGESSTYSRLSELEGKLQAVTSQVTMIEPTDTTKIEQALNNYNKRLSIINSQLDESFQIWHVDYNAPTNSSGALIVPTVTTYEPSKSWASTTYSEHEGDFVVTLDGIVYEFVKLDETWQWKIVTDKYLVSAVTQINSINATLDNMASDSVITREEELVLQKIWAAEVADHSSLLKKATEYEIDYDSYDGKYDTLEGLMNAVFTTLETQETASINEGSWNTAWQQYWSQKVLLEEALSKFVTAGLSVRPKFINGTNIIEARLYADDVVLDAAHKMEFDAETISINSNEFILNEYGAMFKGDLKNGKYGEDQYANELDSDGSGHVAKGKLSWNKNGDLTFHILGEKFFIDDATEGQIALSRLFEAFTFYINTTTGKIEGIQANSDFWSVGSVAAYGRSYGSTGGGDMTFARITESDINSLT